MSSFKGKVLNNKIRQNLISNPWYNEGVNSINKADDFINTKLIEEFNALRYINSFN